MNVIKDVAETSVFEYNNDIAQYGTLGNASQRKRHFT